MQVSVIIVNYNTRRLLCDCLESVKRLTRDVDYEVIVVDNASHDDSREVVTRDYPWVQWIQSEENLGFGRANNLGARRATGKYLFLLNSDTILVNNAIKKFFDYFECAGDDSALGAIGCMLLDSEKRPNHSFGFFPSVRSEWLYLLRLGQLGHLTSGITGDVDYITGADLFIPRVVFERLRGFDPDFFMYYEETDLQLRMSRIGLKRVIISGPQIIHKDGSSFEGKGLTFSRFMMAQRSYNHYIKKNFHGIARLWYRINISIIRMKILFQFGWSLTQRFQAIKLVLTQASKAPQFK